eukprot:3276400-Rhodomonas_salina.1
MDVYALERCIIAKLLRCGFPWTGPGERPGWHWQCRPARCMVLWRPPLYQRLPYANSNSRKPRHDRWPLLAV